MWGLCGFMSKFSGLALWGVSLKPVLPLSPRYWAIKHAIIFTVIFLVSQILDCRKRPISLELTRLWRVLFTMIGISVRRILREICAHFRCFFIFVWCPLNSLAANGLVTGVQKQEVEFLRHHSFGDRDTLSMPPLCCFLWVFGSHLVSSAYLAWGRIAPGPSLPLISWRVT